MNQGGFTYGRGPGWGWSPPRPDLILTHLIYYGRESCVDGLLVTFIVNVAFSMWRILPLPLLVPTWAG